MRPWEKRQRGRQAMLPLPWTRFIAGPGFVTHLRGESGALTHCGRPIRENWLRIAPDFANLCGHCSLLAGDSGVPAAPALGRVEGARLGECVARLRMQQAVETRRWLHEWRRAGCPPGKPGRPPRKSAADFLQELLASPHRLDFILSTV